MEKGKFFVIEGQDGTGKTVQTELLVDRVRKDFRQVPQVEDFPQYGKKSAWLLERYLKGEEGSNVPPKLAALYFSVDRLDARARIKKKLKDGFIVIANRFTASNAGHQGSKIRSRKGRREFFEWLWNVEFIQWEIPRPDMNFLLLMPLEFSLQLMEERQKKDTQRPVDIHESDRAHLARTVESYRDVVELFPEEFRVIECVENNTLLSPEQIHEKIWAHISLRLPKPIIE